mgnify:CR=1 FL=1
MKKTLPGAALAALTVLTAGCASSRTLHMADGWPVEVIDCSGPHLGFGHCVAKAGEVCRYGYTLLKAEGGSMPASAADVTGGGLLDMSGRMETRRLLVRCH